MGSQYEESLTAGGHGCTPDALAGVAGAGEVPVSEVGVPAFIVAVLCTFGVVVLRTPLSAALLELQAANV